MTTDDSMSDDVFEAEDGVGLSSSTATGGLNVLANNSGITPSPTGYKDYRPPSALFEAPKSHEEEVAHKVNIK